MASGHMLVIRLLLRLRDTSHHEDIPMTPVRDQSTPKGIRNESMSRDCKTTLLTGEVRCCCKMQAIHRRTLVIPPRPVGLGTEKFLYNFTIPIVWKRES